MLHGQLDAFVNDLAFSKGSIQSNFEIVHLYEESVSLKCRPTLFSCFLNFFPPIHAVSPDKQQQVAGFSRATIRL